MDTIKISPIYDHKLKGYFYHGQFTPDHCVHLVFDKFCSEFRDSKHGYLWMCPMSISKNFYQCRLNLVKVNGMVN